jgi:hypothetical protein
MMSTALVALEQELGRAGIASDAYSLTGGTWEDRYHIDPQAQQRWQVYYVERGRREDVKTYTDEREAITDLRRRLLNDPTSSR